MIFTVSAAIALLLSILSIFFELFILKILLIPFVLAAFIGALLSLRKGIKPSDESGDLAAGPYDPVGENRRLTARLAEIEESYRKLSEEKRESDSRLETLINDASYLCSSLPLMKKLGDLVIDKTEESAISLTDNIFHISKRSSDVGNHIRTFLGDLFTGEKSLKSNIDILSGEMKRIDKLIEDFTAISKRYTVDMKHIEENVNVINGFLDGIRDVSDRTGLLAINSSIEAARVGTAGKGFSVLAGEIQGLASSSRDISLQIDEVVAGISERVEESFSVLEAEIAETLKELRQTQQDLQKISSSLDEKFSDVENHVKDSDTLAKTVTEQLNNVTVNMQYQDITRQILEHVMGVLNYYRVRMEEKEPRLIAESENKVKKEEILDKASSYFTIEDEWRLFGLKMMVGSATKSDSDEDFKGDVEMF